jgi:hypothetical protein
MKFSRTIPIIAAVFLIAMSCLATADVLPKQVPENQVFSLNSMLDAVGATNEKTSVIWQVGDAGLAQLPNATAIIANGLYIGERSGSIAYAAYSDWIITNGGQISEVKSFKMDTTEKTEGLYNIETAKVLTYTSQNGSHLMGEESYVLDVAGNWSLPRDDIVCVFSQIRQNHVPAFCNRFSASSKLSQITTAQIETQGALTAIGAKSDVPAALKYEISVAPDANSASGYADGIVSTRFTIGIMEGRTDGDHIFGITNRPVIFNGEVVGLEFYDELAATMVFEDTATVAGGISLFNKGFSYQSGIKCANC